MLPEYFAIIIHLSRLFAFPLHFSYSFVHIYLLLVCNDVPFIVPFIESPFGNFLAVGQASSDEIPKVWLFIRLHSFVFLLQFANL